MRIEQAGSFIRGVLLCLCLSSTFAATQERSTGSGRSLVTEDSATDHTWWKHATIYEIYPRSFQDSNGDGIGDLNGITQRLDYLHDLGVSAIWLTPMYASPQVDFGYDISNFVAIHPQYGTLAEFDRLVTESKKRQIRIILDLVLNHTSNQHPWFTESSSSRSNPKADWYVWNDGKPADANQKSENLHEGLHGLVVPPNNWVSQFGGSAWEWDPARKQFYYHQFYKQQPDLNWRNPKVEKAIFDAMKFWLDRGVAGFRLDAVNNVFEDAQLRDNPVAAPGRNAYGDPNLSKLYTADLPEEHELIRRMRAMTDTYPGDRVLIGETGGAIEVIDRWYGGANHDELHLPMDSYLGFHTNLKPGLVRKALIEAETELHGSQPLFVFDNHDRVRSIDRFGDGVHDLEIAKAVATILLSTRATAMMYYGEELGMTTSTPTDVRDVKDPIGIAGWPKEKGRDGERTPMQWNGSLPHAGFSKADSTWLPIARNYRVVNVETERQDPTSLLHWYKNLITLRGSNAALYDGQQIALDVGNQDILGFVRESATEAKRVVVLINLSVKPQRVQLRPTEKGLTENSIKVLLTSQHTLQNATTLKSIELPPFCSFIAEIQ